MKKKTKEVPSMGIYTSRGARVEFSDAEAGYPHDQETLKKNKLKLGGVYTVDEVIVYGFSSTLYLKEFPGIPFNTVNFSNV